MATFQNLTVDQVKAKIDSGESFRLIDVREPGEHAVAHIEGAELLPLSRANDWINDLTDDTELVIFCHHGGRSAQVSSFLAARRGFTQVANMVGGIEEWSQRIDPSVQRY